MRLLLFQAQTQLATYVDYGTCPTDPRVTQWINMAIERLLPVLNPEKTISRFMFPVVNLDGTPGPSVMTAQGQCPIITLPRDVKTALAGFLDYPTQDPGHGGICCCDLRQLVQVRNRWYEVLPGGPINYTGCSPSILSDLGTGFSTFDDVTPDDPCFIRIYVDIPQPTLEGTVDITGNDPDGNPVWSLADGIYAQCLEVPIPIQGQNYVDSTIAFSSIQAIKKAQTVSRVKLFAVSVATGEQRPIAVLAPDELAPDYRRYRLNWCLNPPIPANLTVFVKRQFVQTTDPDADLLITNIGALKNALQALKYEDAGSEQLAETHWTRAQKILNEETRDYDGDYAATIQIQASCWTGGEIWNLH